MPVITKEITIDNELGLHARPAAIFVKKAIEFESNVTVIKKEERVDGKSIMGILTLEAHHGTKVILEIEGEDAEQALEALERILKGKDE